MWLPRARGVGRKWGMTGNRYKGSFGGDENVLKLVVVMVT